MCLPQRGDDPCMHKDERKFFVMCFYTPVMLIKGWYPLPYLVKCRARRKKETEHADHVRATPDGADLLYRGDAVRAFYARHSHAQPVHEGYASLADKATPTRFSARRAQSGWIVLALLYCDSMSKQSQLPSFALQGCCLRNIDRCNRLGRR